VPVSLARRIVEQARPDAVVVAFPEFAYLREAVAENVFRVYDSHEVRYTTCRRRAKYETAWYWRLYWRIESRRMKTYEARTARAYDLVAAISERDRALLRGLGCRQVAHLPEGAEPTGEPRGPVAGHVALFLGNFTNMPNVDAVRWLARDIWPLVRRRVQDAELWVAGQKAPRDLRALDGRDGVRMRGFVDDIAALFAQVRLMVLPMRMGGGQKIKLVQAMAAGLPVVATPEGAEGMSLEEGKDLLCAREPEQFAAEVARVMTDDATARELGRAARERVASNYRKRDILERFEEALELGVRQKTNET